MREQCEKRGRVKTRPRKGDDRGYVQANTFQDYCIEKEEEKEGRK